MLKNSTLRIRFSAAPNAFAKAGIAARFTQRKSLNKRSFTPPVGPRWQRIEIKILPAGSCGTSPQIAVPTSKPMMHHYIELNKHLGPNQARLINLPAAHTKSGVNFWNAN
jgi:hypothetical protein